MGPARAAFRARSFTTRTCRSSRSETSWSSGRPPHRVSAHSASASPVRRLATRR